MISWIIVAIVIACGFLFIKLSGARHKIGLMLFVLLILFLFGTASIIVTRNKLDFSNTEGLFEAVKLYFGLLGNGFSNLRNLAGNAIGMDWDNTNGTFFNKTEILPDKR